MNAIAKVMPAEPRDLQPATTPSHLLAMAVQQGADLDKLEKLMELQERWEANEARKAFTAAMSAFKAEPVDIFKAKNVSFSGTSYNHAELSDVTAALNPALAKHDLSFRWDVSQDGQAITVACVLTHIAGHSERITMSGPPDDSGKKNRIQQIASTVTYLQRYTLLAITGTSTKDMDDDAQGSEGDDVDQSWLDGIDSAIDQFGLKALKAEMVTTFGTAQAIPKALIHAYNQRWAELGK